MDIQKVDIKPGTLLLSEPFLNDSSFTRSVVLVTEHSDKGSLGFIINKPTGHNIGEVLEKFPQGDAPLFLEVPLKPIRFFICIPSKGLPTQGKLPTDYILEVNLMN